MEQQKEQQDYFRNISGDYAEKYRNPEGIVAHEKVKRLETALDLIQVENPNRVLEIGVGSGEFFRRYDGGRERIGVDLSAPMIETARVTEPTPEYLQGSITNLPLKTGSTDLIVCLGVVGYLDREQLSTAVSELGRVLDTGGQLILSFANRASLFRRARQFYYYWLLEWGKAITGWGTPVTSDYTTYRPESIRTELANADCRVTTERYLTYSTGIFNTTLNLKAYKFLDKTFDESEMLGKLAMTWVVSAIRE